MANLKAGGPFAIAGFVFQFLNTVDQGLVASLKRTSGDQPILVLEPENADAACRGAQSRIIQYKMRSSREWSTQTILFEILPPLLRAALTDPDLGYSPSFVTSGGVRNGVALRALLAALGKGKAAAPLKVGRKTMEGEAIFAGIAERVALSEQEAQASAFRARLRALLAKVTIEDGVQSAAVRQRVLEQLHKATGSHARAKRAYQALFTFIAERSQQPAALITAREFLDAAELTPERLAPLLNFERNLADFTGDALTRRGYARHKDVRQHSALPEATVVLVEGVSGSGKTWSLAGLAARELERGQGALWVDEVESLDALEDEIVRQLWHMALQRTERGDTSLPTLLGDVADLLGRDKRLPLLIALDRLPRRPVERARLLRFDWGRAGIRLLVAVTQAEASDIQHTMAAPVLSVGDFSQAELRDLLDRSGIAWATLPTDVRGWIKRPVLASLYASLAAETGSWCGASEFELMDRFADRAGKTGEAEGVPDCRAVIAALGASALAKLPPLEPHRLNPRPTSDQLRILAETGWLQRDMRGGLEFAHDRLRDWAIAEHLSGEVGNPAELARRLPIVAGYGKQESAQPTIRAGHALLDGVWLLAQSADGTERLRSFLAAIDQGEWAWQLPDDFYGDLLPAGGPKLFDKLLPILRERLAAGANGPQHYHTVRCLDGFIRAGPASSDAIASLLWSDDREAQKFGCRFAAQQPESRHLERLAKLHAEASGHRPDDNDLWALGQAAWKALLQCLLKRPGWLSERIDRAAPNYASVGHLLSLLPKLPEGRRIWARHGTALVAGLGKDSTARYWLARAIDAFQDRRFDTALAEWSLSHKDMAALPAWTALCRHRTDLVADVAPRLPHGIFAWNSAQWLQPLFAPEARSALRIVLDTLKAQDPSGCTFALALSPHANDLDIEDIVWAAERLDAALAAPSPRDLTASRLLDLFMEIDEPALIGRLPDLIPETLPGRLIDLAQTKLKNAGLWHDPELEGAVALLLKLGGAHAVAVTREQLGNAHPTIRWMAVREAVFADLELIRGELEALICAAETDKESGRLEALQLLAIHDPRWGHAHIRQKLDEGTCSSRNEAFWLAIRLTGDDYVSDALALLPQAFAGPIPLYCVVDYLIARGAGREAVARVLSDILPHRKKEDRGGIVNRLLSVGIEAADEAVLSGFLPNAGTIEQAEFAFWGILNRPGDQRWRTLADTLITSHETQTLRHARGFYEAAASLGAGPAYDQLLSDAYPAAPGGSDRALMAIRALARRDEAGAADALTRLCLLQEVDDRELDKFAQSAGRLGFPGDQLAVLRGAINWPAEALQRALTRPRRGYSPELLDAVARDLESTDPGLRRIAAIAAPLVLGAPPVMLLDDREESVRHAARAATSFHAQRRRVQALLTDMAQAPPDRSRRAAAALFSLAERAKPNRAPLAFSWSEFVDAAPSESGFLLAVPR